MRGALSFLVGAVALGTWYVAISLGVAAGLVGLVAVADFAATSMSRLFW